jgi:energy-coupling factor transport system substrate-specific component
MNKRTIILEIIIIAVLIPVLLFLSLKFGDRQYYIGTVAVMILTMLPFFLHFEYRMPTARELVTLSVMAALCAAGRIAFVMVPNFSAMTGMIMICGIALGPEAVTANFASRGCQGDRFAAAFG